jgi:CubicO group peptidase (beta-lactamase class C family)
MRHLALLPAVVLTACGGGGVQSPSIDAPPAPIDAPLVGLAADLHAIRVEHGVPALAAAVASSTGVIDLAAVGTRHLGTTAGVETDDRWHLGSDTKAMTATLVAMAVEGGLLTWDTTLAEALPAIADMHPAYRDVPIDWLLAHRAGTWTDFAPHESELAAIDENAPVATQRAMFADIMLSAAPERTPGSAYAYSNAGYMVAGAILEAVYNRPWEQLMRERIFTPLAMASCGFGPPGNADLVDEPWGHQGENMVPMPPDAPGADNPPILGPAGTVHCALTDWAQFGALQLGTRPDLVSAASLTRLHTSLGDGYALGWLTGTSPQGRYLAHDGSNTLWYARIVVLLDADRVLLVATNAGSTAASAAVDDATELLLAGVP